MFCGGMTFFLARSEFSPESSLLHQVPPQYVLQKILKHENISALKIDWKDETIGSFNLRVTTGERPLVRSSLQCVIPALGQKPKLRFEINCRLKSNREVESFRIQGRWQEIDFTAVSDDPGGRIELEAHGPGIDTKRDFFARDFLKPGNTNLLAAIPEFSRQAPLLQAGDPSAMLGRWRANASSTRISRRDEWMDAYLLSARLDENFWVKVWVSPTGELLKLDSSFGLRAINEDFFEGLAAEAKPSKKRKHS